MLNKYTLRFKDATIEAKYQQYQGVTVRKFTLLLMMIVMVAWGLMDCAQSLIEGKFTYLNYETLTKYVASFMIILISFIIYLCKPDLIKWALLILNHTFAYYYTTQDKSYTFWQSNLGTYVVVGSQIILMISADCLAMYYQITLFTTIYILKMVLQEDPFAYSLLFGTVTMAIGFCLNLFYIQKIQREQFKFGFIHNQWEKILITFLQNQSCFFDYDNYTQSFNYRDSKQFEEITDSLRSLFFKY